MDKSVTGRHDGRLIPITLNLDGRLLDLASRQPVWRMPEAPVTGIEQSADVAIRWIERGWMESNPLVALLFLFFALEALLGDKGEDLKSHNLAFRQALLAVAADGRFTVLDPTLLLYDRVRSCAVHGSGLPEVHEDTVGRFSQSLRLTLAQYLRFATDKGVHRQNQLVTMLDSHPERINLAYWLRRHGHRDWYSFIDGILPDSADYAADVLGDREPTDEMS
jgi:hypothetical protein